ncbi:Lar family restriction alleviation protein [Dactylosporangium sp. AC04546]|uniref:Lar family restriction alleviation protein n=1 Tax=Dactylosporangium sp. AC04546 TaxID=2862460 RepID=UPI001EDE1C44|nr:Lar family restriction alleviation protein [Dactylosporangium sp. AC04546]WVK87341.1 Lar family restriction alleviation protein [Dactylosporangium sp. AC04546]
MTARVARSVQECLHAVALRPCPACGGGDTAVVDAVGGAGPDGLVVESHCERCGAAHRHDFTLDERTAGPSRLIDVDGYLLLYGRSVAALPDDPARLDPAALADAAELAETALTLLDEAIAVAPASTSDRLRWLRARQLRVTEAYRDEARGTMLLPLGRALGVLGGTPTVQVGARRHALTTEEDAVWSAAHHLPGPRSASGVVDGLLAAGLLAEVDEDGFAAFAATVRLVPLTTGAVSGPQVPVTPAAALDEAVFAVWSAGGLDDLATTCRALAGDRSADLLAAVFAQLHRLLAGGAAYLRPVGA